LHNASHANESEEQRIWTVTTIASLAYGNSEAKNPEALYERMKSIKHESLCEMVRFGSSIYTNIEYSMRGNDATLSGRIPFKLPRRSPVIAGMNQ